MPYAIIIKLIAEVGLPLATQLIDLYHAGKSSTPEQWAELKKLMDYRSADSLAAQGLKIEDGKLVPL